MKRPPARAARQGRLGARVPALEAGRAHARSVESSTEAADAAVDFTRPDAVEENVRACLEAACRACVGTTGLRPRRASRRSRACSELPVFFAPNFALGAVLMLRFAAEAAEAHAARRDRRAAPRDEARRAVRHGEGDRALLAGSDAPIHSVRLPGLVAHQEVIFGGPGETLTIRHDTISREAFVPGVLLALERVRELPPGLTVGLDALL